MPGPSGDGTMGLVGAISASGRFGFLAIMFLSRCTLPARAMNTLQVPVIIIRLDSPANLRSAERRAISSLRRTARCWRVGTVRLSTISVISVPMEDSFTRLVPPRRAPCFAAHSTERLVRLKSTPSLSEKFNAGREAYSPTTTLRTQAPASRTTVAAHSAPGGVATVFTVALAMDGAVAVAGVAVATAAARLVAAGAAAVDRVTALRAVVAVVTAAALLVADGAVAVDRVIALRAAVVVAGALRVAEAVVVTVETETAAANTITTDSLRHSRIFRERETVALRQHDEADDFFQGLGDIRAHPRENLGRGLSTKGSGLNICD